MTTSTTTIYRCDACGAAEEYRGLGVAPNGWAIPNIAQRDGEDVTPLHVCPSCTREALDEWLPNNTWWGSTENWR